MPYDQAVAIDMDQEVTLRVRVSVGERYGHNENLSQEFTAPLFVINNIQIRDVAETLCQRVLQIFIAKLRGKEGQRMREEQLQEAYDHGQKMEEEIKP